GDMLRDEVARGTELGRQAREFMDAGKLVPDDVIIAMVRARIARPDAGGGWILDGFPRTLPQANALDAGLGADGLTHAVWFAVPRATLIARLTGRRTCAQCGAIWHVEFAPTKVADRCDRCGGALQQREDDRPAAVEKRLEVFALQTEPLLAYYRGSGKLVEIDADRSPDRVYEQLAAALGLQPRPANPMENQS